LPRTFRKSCGPILGKPFSIHTQSWPKVDEPSAAAMDEITLVVQVNGKVR